MFPLFGLRVSVDGGNVLKYRVFATDTPVAGYRWVLYFDRYSVINTQHCLRIY